MIPLWNATTVQVLQLHHLAAYNGLSALTCVTHHTIRKRFQQILETVIGELGVLAYY